MIIATQHRGPYGTVVLTGTGEESTAMALSTELRRLLEADVTSIVLDVRAAPDAERWAAGVAERFHHILCGLGGGLRVEPPWAPRVQHVVPGQRVDEPSRHDDPEPSRWFG